MYVNCEAGFHLFRRYPKIDKFARMRDVPIYGDIFDEFMKNGRKSFHETKRNFFIFKVYNLIKHYIPTVNFDLCFTHQNL